MTRSLREAPEVAPDFDGVAADLEREGPTATLEWAFAEFGEGLAIATAFGAEGVVLIDLAVRVEPRPHVFFVDTGFIFPETNELRRALEARYGIEIRAVEPELTPQQQEDVFGARLWAFDSDFCCSIRKVDPLDAHLEGFAAWATAIRRDQTEARAATRVVERDERRGVVKISPLAAWSRRDVWAYIHANGLPYNPLHDRGYPSVGCTHCTRAVRPGEDERAGRWAGSTKTECGLHLRREKP
jgi:phosphoadenosine phosphosulfate reductase